MSSLHDPRNEAAPKEPMREDNCSVAQPGWSASLRVGFLARVENDRGDRVMEAAEGTRKRLVGGTEEVQKSCGAVNCSRGVLGRLEDLDVVALVRLECCKVSSQLSGDGLVVAESLTKLAGFTVGGAPADVGAVELGSPRTNGAGIGVAAGGAGAVRREVLRRSTGEGACSYALRSGRGGHRTTTSKRLSRRNSCSTVLPSALVSDTCEPVWRKKGQLGTRGFVRAISAVARRSKLVSAEGLQRGEVERARISFGKVEGSAGVRGERTRCQAAEKLHSSESQREVAGGLLWT